MKNMIKKAVCMLCATICVMGTALTVSADTVSFTVTPPNDPYTYAVRKADYEQRFYVTGTSFSKSGILRCTSGRAGQGGSSFTTNISPGIVASSAEYILYAYPGYTYEMFTSSSLAGMTVTGWYTP